MQQHCFTLRRLQGVTHLGRQLPIGVTCSSVEIRTILSRSRVDLPAQANVLRCARTATTINNGAFRSTTIPRHTNPACLWLRLDLGLGFRVGVVAAVSQGRKQSHRRAKNPLPSRDQTLLDWNGIILWGERLSKFACAGRSTPAIV